MRPRHARDRAARELEVDAAEHGRTGGVVTDGGHAVRLERLRRPGKLRGAGDAEGRSGDAGELRVVVEGRAARGGEGDDAVKGRAGGGADGGGEEGIGTVEVPRGNGPECTSTGSGRPVLVDKGTSISILNQGLVKDGTHLEDGLENGGPGVGLNRVEQEHRLPVVGGGDRGHFPRRGERRDGGRPRVEPRRVGDPAGLKGGDSGLDLGGGTGGDFLDDGAVRGDDVDVGTDVREAATRGDLVEVGVGAVTAGGEDLLDGRGREDEGGQEADEQGGGGGGAHDEEG